jgi:hypothetical protein
MKIKFAPNIVAGWLYLLPAAAIAIIWYILFFVGRIPHLSLSESVIALLRFFFGDSNPHFWFFVWLATLPLLCIGMCILYLCGAARTRPGGIILFLVTIVLAGVTLVFLDWSYVVLVALPSLWGYRAIHAM